MKARQLNISVTLELAIFEKILNALCLHTFTHSDGIFAPTGNFTYLSGDDTEPHSKTIDIMNINIHVYAENQ